MKDKMGKVGRRHCTEEVELYSVSQGDVFHGIKEVLDQSDLKEVLDQIPYLERLLWRQCGP